MDNYLLAAYWALGIMAAGLLACGIVRLGFRKSWQIVSMTMAVFVGMALMAIHIPAVEETEVLWERCSLALLDVLRCFTLDYSFEPRPYAITEDLKFYYAVEIGLSVAAAFCSAALLLSLLRRFGRIWRFLMPYRPVYYFSELNEKSFVLAQNIQRAWKQAKGHFWNKPLLIFCKSALHDDEEELRYHSEARKLGAIFYQDPIFSIPKSNPRRRTVKVFLMDTDENANISTALKMKKWITGSKKLWFPRRNVDSDLLVFSTEDSAEILFDKLLETVKNTRVEELKAVLTDEDIANAMLRKCAERLAAQAQADQDPPQTAQGQKKPDQAQAIIQKARSRWNKPGDAQTFPPPPVGKEDNRVDVLVTRLKEKIYSNASSYKNPAHEAILDKELRGRVSRLLKSPNIQEDELLKKAWDGMRWDAAWDRYSREDSAIDLHLVNETEFIAQKLLWEHPLFHAQKNGKVSMLLVGAGRLGMEILRTAMICGTMYHCELKAVVVDQDAQRLEKQFYHNYPCLKPYQKNALTFCQADVTTTELDRALEENGTDCRYIVVATGDDERNLLTAQFLRRWYARKAIQDGTREFGEQLYVAIRSSERHETLSELGEKNMTLFGSNTRIFSPEELLDRHVDRMAMWYNLCYDEGLRPGKIFPNPKGTDPDQIQDQRRKREEENKREAKRKYCRLGCDNQRSNQLLALHCLYKLYDLEQFGGLGQDPDSVKQLTGLVHCLSRYSDAMFELEHERWEVFQRLNGWGTFSREQIRAGLDSDDHQKGTHRHPLAKLHGCMIPYDQLDDLAGQLRRKDFRLFDKAMCVAGLLVWLKEVRLLSDEEKGKVRKTAEAAIETIRQIPATEDAEMTGEVFLQRLCEAFPKP